MRAPRRAAIPPRVLALTRRGRPRAARGARAPARPPSAARPAATARAGAPRGAPPGAARRGAPTGRSPAGAGPPPGGRRGRAVRRRCQEEGERARGVETWSGFCAIHASTRCAASASEGSAPPLRRARCGVPLRCGCTAADGAACKFGAGPCACRMSTYSLKPGGGVGGGSLSVVAGWYESWRNGDRGSTVPRSLTHCGLFSDSKKSADGIGAGGMTRFEGTSPSNE
jgi:hypothetical protein